ncbi:MAG: cupin domain-containing protein, partial [Paracoccaceae bacterium]|nr:cupin domain-containing protein [Paracoccaceae bacterium]
VALHLRAGIDRMSVEIGQDQSATTESDAAPGSSTMSDLGRRLRDTRKAKKKTLRVLAEEVGCSPSMLSKIENDQAAPSLRTLHRILAALDTSIVHLFAGEAHHDEISLMRADDRPSVRVSHAADGAAILLERLTPTFPELMLDANIHTLEPGADSGGDIQHAGQEVGYVLQGRAELIVAGKSHFLGPGDSFFFASNLPHRYRNIDPGVTRILWVATPATF